MDFSVSEAKTLFSAVTELYKKGSTLEAEQKMLILKEAFIELKAESLELRLELQEIRESQQEKESLSFEAPFYYIVNGEEKDGPFCQRCYDVDGKKIRLLEHKSVFGSHICRQCKNQYGPPSDHPSNW